MTIRINAENDEQPGKRVRLWFWLPNCLLSSRLTWAIVNRFAADKVPATDALRLSIKHLTRYKRHHGHFTLVDVRAADGTLVKIVY